MCELANDIKPVPDNLTDLLLSEVRKRPAMYLHEPLISNLSTFIVGYMLAKPTDEYFGNNGFVEWFFNSKNISMTPFWESPILDEASGNEHKALLLYFDYLAKYKSAKRHL